jgi:hypothetical protein
MHTSTFDYKKIILLYGSAKAFINEHDTEDGRHFSFHFGPKTPPPVIQVRLIIK